MNPFPLEKRFQEGCWECGAMDHRRFECPRYTARLKAKGLREVTGSEASDSELAGWFLSEGEDETYDGDGAIASLRRGPRSSISFLHKNPFEALSREGDDDSEDVQTKSCSLSGTAEPQELAAGSVRPRPSSLERTKTEKKEAEDRKEDKRKHKDFGLTAAFSSCHPPCRCEADSLACAAAGCSQDSAAGSAGAPAAVAADRLISYLKVRDNPPEEPWQPTGQALRRSSKKRARRAELDSKRLAFLQCPHKSPRLAPVVKGQQVIRAIIDSGAEDTVTPPKTLPSEVVPSPMSQAGQTYRAANGAAIANFGKTVFSFNTANGTKCVMPFQVADVEKPLVSVARMTDAGNRVVFEKGGGYVESTQTGRRVRLQRDGNVFVLDMFVPRPAEEEKGGKGGGGGKRTTGFTRQER